MHLAQIAVRVKAVGVSRLDVPGHLSPLAGSKDTLDFVEIKVDPVDTVPLDGKSRAAVDPQSPAAEVGDSGARAGGVEVGGDPLERRDTERARGMIVKAYIDIRTGRPASARQGTAEDERHDVRHVSQTRCHTLREGEFGIQVFHNSPQVIKTTEGDPRVAFCAGVG